MSAIDQTSNAKPASVFGLFALGLLPATLMLGGGVTLYAVESYITATVAPSIVRDIGGLALFSWMTTLFVSSAVLGSIFVAMRPRGIGLRVVYIVGALVFGIGSLICAAAPAMPLVLAGRAVQGLGAGMLAALGYAFIRFVYPEPLWRKASTLYAAIWGVATVLGPTLGGLFAAGHAWRYAFVILVPLTIIMAVAARVLLPSVEDDRAQQKTPIAQIALLLGAVLLTSIAGTIANLAGKTALLAISLTGTAIIMAIERRGRNRLLPAGAVMIGRPLARVYLIMFVLMLVLTGDIYVPYFLQTLHGVTPLVSGYLVALVAMGWTIAAFSSASLSGRSASLAIVAGCIVEAAATALLIPFLARENHAADLVLLCPAIGALFFMGFGIGLGWAHLTTRVLGLVEQAEQDKASAAISTVQSLASAFGASLAGVIVNSAGLADPGGISGALSAATWLYGLMALVCTVAVVTALSLRRASA